LLQWLGRDIIEAQPLAGGEARGARLAEEEYVGDVMVQTIREVKSFDEAMSDARRANCGLAAWIYY
jgi:hypothetical protein